MHVAMDKNINFTFLTYILYPTRNDKFKPMFLTLYIIKYII